MTGRRLAATLTAAAGLLAAPVALADPCGAIPDRGPVPAYLRPGAAFSGPVVYVGDGDSLCVAVGPRRGADWVEVRLADFYAPELHEPGGAAAKATLEILARGRRATCIAGRQTYDRVAARCSIEGRLIGDALRAAGAAEGGRAWRGR